MKTEQELLVESTIISADFKKLEELINTSKLTETAVLVLIQEGVIAKALAGFVLGGLTGGLLGFAAGPLGAILAAPFGAVTGLVAGVLSANKEELKNQKISKYAETLVTNQKERKKFLESLVGKVKDEKIRELALLMFKMQDLPKVSKDYENGLKYISKNLKN